MSLHIIIRMAVFRKGFWMLLVLLALMWFIGWKGESTLSGAVFPDKKVTIDLKGAMTLVKEKAVQSADRAIPYLGPLRAVDTLELADEFDQADEYVGNEQQIYWEDLYSRNRHIPEIAFNYGVVLAKNDYPRLALKVLTDLRTRLVNRSGDNNLTLLVFVNHNIGLVTRKLGSYQESIQYFREVIGKLRILRNEEPNLQYEPIHFGDMKHKPLDAYLYLCKAYEMSEPSTGTLKKPGDANKYQKFHGLLYEGYRQGKWNSNLVWMADNYRLLCKSDYNMHEPRLHLALGRLALKTKHLEYAEEFIKDARRYDYGKSPDVTNRIIEILAIVYFLTDRYNEAMSELNQLDYRDVSGKSGSFVRMLFACLREGEKVVRLNQWKQVWNFFSARIKGEENQDKTDTLEKLRAEIFNAAVPQHVAMITEVTKKKGLGTLIAVEKEFGKTDTPPEINTLSSRVVQDVLGSIGFGRRIMYFATKKTEFFRLIFDAIWKVMVGWTLLVFFSHWLHFKFNIARSGFQKDVNAFNKNKEEGEDYQSLIDRQAEIVLRKYHQEADG